VIDGFLLKKLLSIFVHFVPGVPFLLLCSLLLRRWMPRASIFLSLFFCLILLAGSFPSVTNSIVLRLESQFPVLQQVPEDTGLILVLGHGHIISEGKPVNSLLSPTALARLTEGVRLWKKKYAETPEIKLALSGAPAVSGSASHAQMMSRMALLLGVPENNIVRFETTRDTEHEISNAVGWLVSNNMKDRRLVVVSTAMHLPRASLLLAQYDISYAMAPTEFTVSESGWRAPNVYSLLSLDRAIHEWVGMAWYRLKFALPRNS